MKSRNVLAAAIAVVLLTGAPLVAQAQQAPVKVVLKNVPALPGATGDAVGTVDGDPQQKAAIPLVGTLANLDSHGNIVVECLTTSGNCPNIGSGSGGTITGVPTLSFTVPASAVAANDTSTRLQWSTGATADACYGVKIEKKGATGTWEAYTPPAGSIWSKEFPANVTASTGYVLGNLGRSSTAGVDTEYRFTLRCYSKTVNDVDGTDAVAIKESTSATVTLASSSGTPPTGNDYCSEYYPAGHPARSAPGFSVDGTLTRANAAFAGVFSNGDSQPTLFADLVAGTTWGRGGIPGSHAPNSNAYLSIAFTVPATIPARTGFKVTFAEPQGYDGMTNATTMEYSISPCPGDFRERPATNTSSDYYARRACRSKAQQGLQATSGNLAGPSDDAYCFLKPGAVMYLNATVNTLDNYRATGGAPVTNCPTGAVCGKKADVYQLQVPL
ncbi:MAG TPA: hypothetical protein PLH21_06035 [Chiayiivirga sp.]|nr:hypothetical protein [Chiayiivirga sp.]